MQELPLSLSLSPKVSNLKSCNWPCLRSKEKEDLTG